MQLISNLYLQKLLIICLQWFNHLILVFPLAPKLQYRQLPFMQIRGSPGYSSKIWGCVLHMYKNRNLSTVVFQFWVVSLREICPDTAILFLILIHPFFIMVSARIHMYVLSQNVFYLSKIFKQKVYLGWK